jgi:hypothetical protein
MAGPGWGGGKGLQGTVFSGTWQPSMNPFYTCVRVLWIMHDLRYIRYEHAWRDTDQKDPHPLPADPSLFRFHSFYYRNLGFRRCSHAIPLSSRNLCLGLLLHRSVPPFSTTHTQPTSNKRPQRHAPEMAGRSCQHAGRPNAHLRSEPETFAVAGMQRHGLLLKIFGLLLLASVFGVHASPEAAAALSQTMKASVANRAAGYGKEKTAQEAAMAKLAQAAQTLKSQQSWRPPGFITPQTAPNYVDLSKGDLLTPQSVEAQSMTSFAPAASR